MPKNGVEYLAQHLGWRTVIKQSKPYVLIVVRGGVAEIAVQDVRVDVDILDFDNLESTGPEDLRLSDNEWAYLKDQDCSLFDFFAPSYEKRND